MLRLKLECAGGGKEGSQVDYRRTPPEQSGGVRAYLIGVTPSLPTDEPLATVERGKTLDTQYERGRGHAPTGAWGWRIG